MEEQKEKIVLSTEKFNKFNVLHPVVIKGWDVVKQQDYGQRYLDIRFQKISGDILAFKLGVVCLSAFDEVIQERTEFTVKDVDRKKLNFSENIPLAPNTEKVYVTLEQYVLTDGKIGDTENRSELVEYNFNNFDTSEEAQAATRLLSVAKGYPVDKKSYWYCACGKLNWKESQNCSACKLNKQEVFTKITPESVQAEKQAYKRQLEEKQKKSRRKFKIVAGSLVAVTLFLILFGLLSATVLPMKTVSSGGMRFEKDYTGSYVLTKCNSSKENIVVPSTVRGVPVTEIDTYAFSHNNSVKSIEISEGIYAIGDYAIYACKNLEKIKLPETLVHIGDCTFAYCESLKEVVMPASIEYIGLGIYFNDITYFFNGESQPEKGWWTDFKTPRKNVIWNHKDHGETEDGLKWVLTNDNTITIYAVDNGDSLTIPNTINGYDVTTIHPHALRQCSFKSVELPDTLTTIGDFAFMYDAWLTEITIPDSVTSIGSYAFLSCSAMTNVNLSKNLKSIGRWAFVDCEKLSSIELPDSLESIGAYAFSGSSISEIYIPLSVTSLSPYAFSEMDKLTAIYCQAEQQPDGWKLHWSDGVDSDNIFWNCIKR